MKTLPWLFASFMLIAGLAVLEWSGYRSLKDMRADLHRLEAEVNETNKLTQEQSASASAARESALEAAARADLAAQGRQQAEAGRQQAEAGRQQAEAGRDQAMTAAQQADAQTKKVQDQMEQMRHERTEELNRMQEALNRVVETRRTSNGMLIVLPNSVFRFPFDSSDLNTRNRELLSRISGILLVSKGYGLSVFGYTDDVGSAEYNLQLSLRRAKAVEDYLVQSGLDAGIINVKGYGKTSPLIADPSEDSRAKNRRVEIALTDSSVRFTGIAE